MTLYFGFVLADGAVDRKAAWVLVRPIAVEGTHRRGVEGMSQPLVARAPMQVALTHRTPVIATGVVTGNVGRMLGSRATTEVALTKRHPVVVTGMYCGLGC